MALILIVDDSPTEVHVMKKALEKSGYQTATAGDGAEGVRMAREMTPDLIFMDVVMPGINGYQATRTLANDPKTRTIPIIMVTSKGRRPTRSGACARAPSTTWSSPCRPISSWRRRRPRSRPDND
jgi:twitching motility two-component system response regulator PilH